MQDFRAGKIIKEGLFDTFLILSSKIKLSKEKSKSLNLKIIPTT
jgi:hypothetical protein